MGEDKIEQKVTVSGEAHTGDITLIGKIVYVVKHPAAWQDAIWGFLAKNRVFIGIGIILEATLAGVYLHYRNLYLIPLWRWWVWAALLIATAWGWYTYGWLRRTKLTLSLALLGTVALVGVIGWQTWQIIFPNRFASDAFGIAVAEIGEGADYQLTAAAKEITGQVYEHLCEAIKREPVEKTDVDPCAIIEQSTGSKRVDLMRIGVIPDSQTAQVYGKLIHASVVIWGQLLTSKEGGVTIQFQVLEIPDRAVNPDFPLIVPVTTQATDMFVKELDLENDPVRLKEIVAQQSTLISSFTLGLLAYLGRDYAQAVIQFEVTAQAMENPALTVSAIGKSQLHFYLGRANHALGQIEVGQQWLRRAQNENPQEPAIPLGLALGDGSLGQDSQQGADLRLALDLANAWLKIHPTDNAATYDRGVIYQTLPQPEDAILDFEAVINHDPSYYIGYISLGQAAAELGRFEQAQHSLQAAITLADKTGTNSAWAHLNLAIVYENAGAAEAAKGEYHAAIAAAPKVDWMYYYYARFLESQQEMDGALDTYRTLTEITLNKGWAYGSLAGFLKRRGLLDEALNNYQQAVHAQPDDALVRSYLAETYFTLGKIDDALREFKIAAENSQNNYYVYASYAGILFQLGKFELAAQMYEKSLALRPIDYAVLQNLGHTYESLGQTEKAKKVYSQIISLSDHFSEEQVKAARRQLQTLGVMVP